MRQLLSHQAGLLGVDGGYDYDELYDHAPLAARLAAQRPHWAPGSAFAYHALTIGVLMDELVLRATGERLGAYLRAHVTRPRGLDVHLGTNGVGDVAMLMGAVMQIGEFFGGGRALSREDDSRAQGDAGDRDLASLVLFHEA